MMLIGRSEPPPKHRIIFTLYINFSVVIALVNLLLQRFEVAVDGFSLVQPGGAVLKSISRRRGLRIRHCIVNFAVDPNKNIRGLTGFLNDELSEIFGEKLGEIKNGINREEEKKEKMKLATEGLSKSFRNMAASTTRRQRCVTGKFPLYITVEENPTRRWLFSGTTKSSNSIATLRLLVNGTSIDRSVASYDRFKWLDGEERVILNEEYALLTLELLGEINVKNPGYVNIMPKISAGFKKLHLGGWTNQWMSRNRLTDTYLSQLSVQESNALVKVGEEQAWITGFSLTEKSGQLHYVDVKSGYMGSISRQTVSGIRWPNEVNSVPAQKYKLTQSGSNNEINDFDNIDEKFLEDSLLIADGFLVPGRSGGLHVILSPDGKAERRVCLTDSATNGEAKNFVEAMNNNDDTQSVDERGWFYHRAIWIDLTNDGRMSILTARAKRLGLGSLPNQDSISSMAAQLIWLERPVPHSYDESTDMPINSDGTSFDPFDQRHIPWKIRILDDGPDVMFSVADFDTSDDTIEVIASQFFKKKITLHSIRKGLEPLVVFSRTLDDRCGSSFSSICANLDVGVGSSATRMVIDSGSTVPTLKFGDPFSHLLVTSHECEFAEENLEEISTLNRKSEDSYKNLDIDAQGKDEHTTSITSKQTINGGSLFSYRVPSGKNAWKTEPWTRSVIATGFHVRGQIGNIINPGAPGFW